MCIVWFVGVEVMNLIIMYKPPGEEAGGTTESRLAVASISFIVNSACNCVIDAATVALPIRDVSRLQLSRRKKYCVGGIFLLGGV